jgi:hypothetical protein
MRPGRFSAKLPSFIMKKDELITTRRERDGKTRRRAGTYQLFVKRDFGKMNLISATRHKRATFRL